MKAISFPDVEMAGHLYADYGRIPELSHSWYRDKGLRTFSWTPLPPGNQENVTIPVSMFCRPDCIMKAFGDSSEALSAASANVHSN